MSINKEDHTRVTARQCLEICGALALDVPSGLRMRPHPEGAPFLFPLTPEVVMRSDPPTGQPESVNNRDARRLGDRDQVSRRGNSSRMAGIAHPPVSLLEHSPLGSVRFILRH